MNTPAENLVAICHHFGLFQRDQVCCRKVTLQQCVTMQTLLKADSEVGPLATKVGNSASAMTRLVDGLLKHGWAKRTRSKKDRRHVLISLTAKGRKEAKALNQITEKTITAVVGQIPKDKREQVNESLQLLRTAIEQAQLSLLSCGDESNP